MRRITIALLFVVVALLATLVPSASLSGVAAQTDPGPVIVTFASADGSTFHAVLEQPADIAAVQEALAGDGYAGIPNGSLAYGDGGVNAPHNWHMVDTALADMTIEVCDGTATMVDEDVTYWVEAVGRFCPWSATVIAVEPLNVTDPYQKCVSSGGIVSEQDQTCTVTRQDSHQNPSGKSGKFFTVTTQTTLTYRPGSAAPTTETKTLSCQNPGGQYLGAGALEHNPNCQ